MAIYLLFIILAVLFVILVILVFKSGKGKDDVLLHNKIDSLREEFVKNILQSQNNFSDDLSKIYERIGGLDRESQQILQLTKSFHDVLKPTKTRGILGENILENLLLDVLPKETVLTQYGFKDGKRVDFAIKLPSGVVPIDAKFSMDVFKNYIDAPAAEQGKQRRNCIDSIKKRIIETASYIYPDEGTTDFVLMYVPSEAVYYFIITETNLLEFSHQKKVFIVGPNTLYVYLKTIFVGFQAIRIEQRAKQIYDNLKRLEKDLGVFMHEYGILGTHIRSASLKYEESERKIKGISAKLNAIEEQNSDNKSAGNTASKKD